MHARTRYNEYQTNQARNVGTLPHRDADTLHYTQRHFLFFLFLFLNPCLPRIRRTHTCPGLKSSKNHLSLIWNESSKIYYKWRIVIVTKLKEQLSLFLYFVRINIKVSRFYIYIYICIYIYIYIYTHSLTITRIVYNLSFNNYYVTFWDRNPVQLIFNVLTYCIHYVLQTIQFTEQQFTQGDSLNVKTRGKDYFLITFSYFLPFFYFSLFLFSLLLLVLLQCSRWTRELRSRYRVIFD